MKVLFVSKYDVLVGGVAEVFASLSAALRPLGVGVVIYSSHASAEIGHLSDGTPCVHGPLPRPGLLGRRRGLRRLIALIRQWKIDLLHGHGLYRGGWAARLASRSTGVPYVVTSHGDALAGASRRARRRSFVRRCGLILQDAAAVTHLTEAMADEAARFGDLADKSTIIPNGVDLRWWNQLADPVPGRYVLAIGRLVATKGFETLLDAWPAIARRADLSLVIAGDGPARQPLEARAARTGLAFSQSLRDLAGAPPPDVVLPGFVGGDVKRNLYAGATLVAFPSQLPESFGLVLAEAMAAGKAVAASDFPSSRCLVAHEQNGLLVPPGDAAAWTEAIARLATDAGLRRRCEENNRQAIGAYDWPALARRYADVYRRAAGA